jgi:hypothetical protein
MANKLYSGFGRESINPDFPVTLSGYGDNYKRPGLGRENTIYITCVALTNEEGKTLMVYTMDGLSADETLANELRAALKDVGCAVPAEQIYLCATHSHSCPAVVKGMPNAPEYRAFLIEKGVKAGLSALEDMSPSTMMLAKDQIPNMAFVRHYIMEDGSFAGVNYGDLTKQPIKCHAAEVDETLVLLRLAREGKQDILMVNFQAHAAMSHDIGRFIISPDWIGHMRNDLERDTGMLVAYYNGASGNQITRSFLPEEKHGMKFHEYGSKMAEYAMALLPKVQPVEGAEIENRHHIFTCKTNNAWDHMLKEANEVFELWHSVGDKEADALARSYGFSSRYQTWQIRAAPNRPATVDREMNAFRVGPIGFTTGTYEMSSTEGIYVRAHSPFDTTFLLCGNRQYIPTSKAYDMRTYEGDTAPYIQGTAEQMAEKYVEMLKEIQ